MNTSPVNVNVLNVDDFIKRTGAMEVTSSLRTEPTTGSFHPNGLFSEEIFGQRTTTDRLYRFGYISLNSKIIHPKVYRNLIRLKRFFTGVLSGETYAVYDKESKMLVQCSEDTEGAGTGYSFFMRNLPNLEFEETESLTTRNRIAAIKAAGKNMFMDKWVVIPAGFRDFEADKSGKASTEEINKLYGSLINLTKAINPSTSDRDIFDGVRFAIQKRCNTIYEYLNDLLAGSHGGKHGFLQHKYGHRNLAYGSGNVISAATFDVEDIDDPRYHSIDVTKLPIVMAAVSFEPAVVYQIKHAFINNVVNADLAQASLIDKESGKLVSVHVSQKTIDDFVTGKGLGKIIERFKDTDFRNAEITMKGEDDKDYYLFYVYDDGDNVYLLRNKHEFAGALGNSFDEKNLHPLTYVEMMYVAAFLATRDKFVQITRYPAIELGSSFITRVYITTTSPAKLVKLTTVGENAASMVFPDWPIVGNSYVDSTQLHPSRLQGLGGDYDGDQVSNNSIMELKSLEECEKYINSRQYLLEPGGGLSTSIGTDVLKLVLFNMTKNPA